MKTDNDPLRLPANAELSTRLFNLMSDGVLITDHRGVIIDCNRAFHENLGYQKSELVGRSISSLDSPRFAPLVAERMAEIKGKGRVTFETAHCRKDGSIMPVEISAHFYILNEMETFFGIVRDLTRRKSSEEALQQRTDQLARAEAIAHIGSWELDLVDNRLNWSDEIYCIFEIDPQMLSPSYEGFLKVIHPEDREMVNRAFQASVSNGTPYEIVHRLLFEDGRIKWVNEQGQTYYDNGKPVRSVGTVQDITERKLAEQALQQSEAKLRSLINTLPDLVWLKDTEGAYLACNHRFEQFFGASEAEILGKTDYDFVDRELADFFRAHDRAAMAAGGPSKNEEEITFASDGHTEMLETIKTPIFRDDGTLIGVLGVARNITARKEYEENLKEGIEIYQAAVNTPGLGFWAVDTKGQLLEVNDAYVQQSGYSREELLQMRIPDLEARESLEEIQARIKEVMERGYSRFRTEQRRKDGSLWPVEVVTTFSPVQGGRFFAFLEDLTEKVEQEQQLKLAASVFETINQAVVITNAENRIVSINPATSQITGYTLEELLGKDPRVFASGRHNQAFYSKMWQTLKTTGQWEGEIWDRRKDGGVYPKWLTISAMRDERGKPSQYVSVFSDITERKKSEETIWRQANFDALTGLANRTLFTSRLQQEVERRQLDDEIVAVLYLDLDGFKDVNDSLGHAAGDQLLMVIAERLQQRLRKSDLVARLGGDEFTMLLSEVEHPEQVASLAEDILERIKIPMEIQGQEIRIAASIGVAFYPEDGESSETLMQHADVAMYQAKEHGKGNFQFFRPEMNEKAAKRLSMIHALHKAVEQQQLQLYYQPKIRLSDHKLIGMEALLRWPTDDGRMVPPDEFIPCAEETGLILPIGNRVLAEACRQTQQWNSDFGCSLKVAVNLSARQFRNHRLVDEVLETLNRESLEPGLLELEITESILMEDIEEAIAVMTRLRSAGISIAIDDFGTGYSSLSYLKRFPITTLKIDRSFVHNLTEDSPDAAIVRSTIGLAKTFGLDVVAEGVETAEQLAFLKQSECNDCQGYHISRPLPAEEFPRFIGTWDHCEV